MFNVGYHEDMNWHNRYALDIGALRWDSTTSQWSSYKKPNAANPSDPINDHHNAESWLMWGQPVYAMSDGEIVSCVRGAPDNDPYFVDGVEDPVALANQIDKFPGGNFLWIRTGAETQVVAHLQQNTIPSACARTATTSSTSSPTRTRTRPATPRTR